MCNTVPEIVQELATEALNSVVAENNKFVAKSVNYTKAEKYLDDIINIYDFDSILICKYQDEYHKRFDQEIYNCKMPEAYDELERFDYKNGMNLYIDDDGYLIFVIYGQGYQYKNKHYLVEMAVKVLPYNDNKDFLDVSDIIKGGNNISVSKNQFDKIVSYLN